MATKVSVAPRRLACMVSPDVGRLLGPQDLARVLLDSESRPAIAKITRWARDKQCLPAALDLGIGTYSEWRWPHDSFTLWHCAKMGRPCLLSAAQVAPRVPCRQGPHKGDPMDEKAFRAAMLRGSAPRPIRLGQRKGRWGPDALLRWPAVEAALWTGDDLHGERYGPLAYSSRMLATHLRLGRWRLPGEAGFAPLPAEEIHRRGLIYIARARRGGIDHAGSGKLYPAGRGKWFVGAPQDGDAAATLAPGGGDRYEAASEAEYEAVLTRRAAKDGGYRSLGRKGDESDFILTCSAPFEALRKLGAGAVGERMTYGMHQDLAVSNPGVRCPAFWPRHEIESCDGSDFATRVGGEPRRHRLLPSEWAETLMLDDIELGLLLGFHSEHIADLRKAGTLPGARQVKRTARSLVEGALAEMERQSADRLAAEAKAADLNNRRLPHTPFVSPTELAATFQLRDEDCLDELGIPHDDRGYRPDLVVDWLARQRQSQRARDVVLASLALVDQAGAAALLST